MTNNQAKKYEGNPNQGKHVPCPLLFFAKGGIKRWNLEKLEWGENNFVQAKFLMPAPCYLKCQIFRAFLLKVLYIPTSVAKF